jgi:hypothetical protein
MLAMNQPEAASNMAMPKLETVLAVHISEKATLAKAPQRERKPISGGVWLFKGDLRARI